jgi:hypothetical protein
MIFKIADIIIKVNKKFKLDKKFRKFYLPRSKYNPNVIIKIQKENHINLDKKSPIFQASNYWSVYSQNNRIIIKDEFNLRDGNPKRIALFDNKFERGDLFVKRKISEYGIVNPLTYPIGSVLFSNILPERKGIFIHASGIKIKSAGFLFCGKSGAGKSTLAELFKDKAKILNDDRIILRKVNNKFFIYGCPWYTERNEFISNERVSLKAIFFIGHGRKNKIKKLNKRQAFLNILRHVYLPIWDKKGVGLSIKLLKDIIENNDCFNLKFLPNESVVEYLSDFFLC